jgi:hypothetical protein
LGGSRTYSWVSRLLAGRVILLVLFSVGVSSMIRVAFIIQVILGLVAGPNGCCCAADRLASLIQANSHAEAASCCMGPLCCDPITEGDSDCETSGACGVGRHSGTKSSCCPCMAPLRPIIHRLELRGEVKGIIGTDSCAIAGDWVSNSGGWASFRPGTSFRSCAPMHDQPGRACSVAFQRWNC